MTERPGAYAGPSDQAEVRAVPEVREATDAAVTVGRLRLDELLGELVERAGEVLATQGRLRRLLDAVVAIGEDLSLSTMLERIVAAACELVDARYGALGVLAPDKNRLSRFITVGINQVDAALIGHLPQGKGILGLLIEDPRPLRLTRLGDHPASYGFPANHPPMSTFLGVPLRIRGEVFGNLYLTEKSDEREFTEEDEQLVVALAAAAGIAIQNAQLYDDEQRNRRWVAASEEITTATLGADRAAALGLIARRACELAHARHSAILIPLDEDTLVIEAADGPAAGELVKRRVDAAQSPAGEVMRTGAPLVFDDPAHPAADRYLAIPRDYQGRAMLVPMQGSESRDPCLGVLMAVQRIDEPLAHPRDVEMLAAFAGQAAVALQLARAQEDRARLAVYEDRDRIARDLHDLVIQRLFAVGMSLQSIARLIDNAQAGERLSMAVDDLDDTIREVRQAIFHLQSTGTDDDLRVRVRRLIEDVASGSAINPRLHVAGPVDTVVPPEIEEHLIAVLREATSNALRHANATTLDVTLEVDANQLMVRIVDDGRGIAPEPTRRSGLANLQRRAEKLGGWMEVRAGASGVGTTLQWSVPLPEVG